MRYNAASFGNRADCRKLKGPAVMRLVLSVFLLAGLSAAAQAQATPLPGNAPPAPPLPKATAAASGVSTAAANAPPPRPLTLSERADIMMARKEYYAAVDLLREDLRQHPHDANLANRIGISYQLLNQPVAASKYYQKAIHFNRHLAQPYNNLGTIYYDERNYGHALTLYHRAIHLSHGTVAAFYVNAGTAEFMRKHLKNAGRDYLAALRLDPLALDPTHEGGNAVQDSSVSDPAQYHFFLSKLYCELGDLPDAMHQFRQALELHYAHIARVCHDKVFQPLVARPDFQAMVTPPAPGQPLPPGSPSLAVIQSLAACRLPPPKPAAGATSGPAQPAHLIR